MVNVNGNDMWKKIEQLGPQCKRAISIPMEVIINNKMMTDEKLVLQKWRDDFKITSRWVEYVSDLYDDNRKEPPDIVEIEGEEILISEVEKAIRDLKTGKACGKDGITTEMIKALDESGIKAITDLCNKIWCNTGVIPSNLNDSIFVRLPKKAKAMDCNEYRTLSLISHVLKVLLRVILLQNRSMIEKEISETQSGFISGKGTREGIFNMRMICERYLDVNKKVFACFIDYEKADCVCLFHRL